jgi:hypothetical protein
MQTINKKSSLAAALLLTLCVTLVSFSGRPGGQDKFEIYLNHKLILEQYVSQTMTPKYLTLHQSNYNDQIDIFYNHCGKIGKQRRIVIKDEQDRILKKRDFADASFNDGNMNWKVKDIMDLQKDRNLTKLNLYYSSAEIPAGRLLAIVVQGNNNYAKNR